MRILFFTPIVLTSAIGRMSKLVVGELLLQGHVVVVVRSEDPNVFENPTHPFACQIVPWNRKKQVCQLALESELVVYQVGNHYPYHCGSLEWLPILPGLVSIHDNFLGHLFWSWSEKQDRQRVLQLLVSLYGDEVADRFFDHSDSNSFITYASEAAPMTEWIASMASSVIVHSSWAMNRITSACSGPVEVVALPYDAPYLKTTANRERPNPDDRIIALTIGHVNRNKRYVSVIEAIGSSQLLKHRLCYRIVGTIEHDMAEEMQSLAARLEVTIAITGPVTDQQLADEIHKADIMCCLRLPALESASASTIEAMLYGKPAIVINTGFYSDLPDECVLKISPQSELIDLQAALERLVVSPDDRMALGQRASEYAKNTFSSKTYANRVAAMKHRLDRCKIILDAARTFSDKLKSWGATGDRSVIDAIATPLHLFR